ncbi:MAG TPA: NACHT domain-containing protein [Xanthobacteraceae bacterium]|jgi:hypothetical protein|nr:NACHT domain-containing protein [Xanthobacteraceae bacterium]
MPNLQIIIAAISTALILGFGIYFYRIYKKPMDFTRDRFAFVGLAVLTSLTLAFIHSLSGTTLWDVLYAGINWLATGKFEPAPATAEGRLLIVLCILIVAYTIIRLHRTWSGKVTEEQWRARQVSEQPNLVLDGIAEIKRLIKREDEPELYDPSKRRELARIDSRPTGVQFNLIARDLFCEIYRDAVFGEDDWHTAMPLWLGRDRRTNRSIILFCTGSNFSSVDVQVATEYLNTLKFSFASKPDLFQIRRHRDDFRITHLSGLPVKSWTTDTLLESLVDIDDYKENIYQRVALDPLPNSELTIERTFTESKVIIEQSKEPLQDFSTFVTKWIADEPSGHIALLGEYGQGKSTSVLKFVHDVLQKRIDIGRLPILIELRGKSPKTQAPLEMLAAWGAYYGISGSALFALLRAGKLLVIFDGFDEMDGLDDERSRYENFVSLWAFSTFEGSRIIITGRPELFPEDTELRRDLAVHPNHSTGHFTTIVKLQRFDIGQIRDALRNLDEQTREEIIELAVKDGTFRDIVSRPSLLQPVAAIWRNPGLIRERDNINSAFVIELFLQDTFHRQSEKARVDRSLRFMRLNESELAFFTEAIAVYMAKERLPNQITNTQLMAAVLKIWQSIGSSLRFPARPDLAEDPTPIKFRLKDVQDAVELIATNIRSYGIIVRDYARNDCFKFSHKSYFELLLGKVAANLILQSTSNDHKLIMNCLTPTISDLLLSVVVSSFCGECLANATRHRGGDSKFLLDKIYDFVARTKLGRRVPRPLHRIFAIHLPTLFIMRRVKNVMKNKKLSREVRNEKLKHALLSRSALRSMSVVFTLVLLVYTCVFFVALSFSNWFEPQLLDLSESAPIGLAFFGILLSLVGIILAAASIRQSIFDSTRVASLLTLSEAAVGAIQTKEYYGKSFRRIALLRSRIYYLEDISDNS